MIVMVTVLFVAWVGFYTWRGYRKGFLLTAVGLFGFVAAYGICFFWVGDLARVLKGIGLSSAAALITAIIVLFFGASFLLGTLPKFILERSIKTNRGQVPILGAGLGAIFGVISGLVLVWCFALVDNTVLAQKSSIGSASTNQGNQTEPELKSDHAAQKPLQILPNLASKMVGSIAAAGVRVSGTDRIETKALGAMLQQPDVFIGGIKSLSQSPQLKQFTADPKAQYLMATNDVSSLVQTQSFKALRNQPGMNDLIAMLEPGENTPSGQDVDRVLAEKLTFVWRRMQYLKHDARVQEILQDPQVNSLIQQQNPAKLLLSPKIHQLINLVMEDQPEMANVDFTQFVGTGFTATDNVAKPGGGRDNEDDIGANDDIVDLPSRPDTIYKWYDEQGKARYTDLKNIPKDKLDKAVLMTR